MKQQLVVLAFVALVTGILGCSNNSSTNSPAPLTDQQAVTQIVTSVDSVAQFLSSEETTINDGGLRLINPGNNAIPQEIKLELGVIRLSTADSVVEWGRVVYENQIVRDYNVLLVGDTVAIVTITKHVPGDFQIAWGIRPNPSTDSVIIDTVIHKPFTEVLTRKVALKRIGRGVDPVKNWLLVSMTFVTSKTAGSVSFGIDSLEISDPHVGYDSTFIDPLQTWFRFGRYRESIPVFHAGDSVTVRISVSGTDSLPEIVTIRHGIEDTGSLPIRMRVYLVSQTGGPGQHTRIFQRKFAATLPHGALIARFNALADVFPVRCFSSDTAIYENEFWGLPYIVIQ